MCNHTAVKECKIPYELVSMCTIKLQSMIDEDIREFIRIIGCSPEDLTLQIRYTPSEVQYKIIYTPVRYTHD